MRKALTIIVLFTTLMLRAQRTPEQLGGVYYAYPAPAKTEAVVVPDGYSLVGVSHYGRHGSRWLTSDARYEWVLHHFDDDSRLTRQGRRAKRLLQRVCDHARGHGGQLTPVGERQHGGIAARMTRRFPIFGAQTRVEARSSVSGRCRKSMEAFVGALGAVYPDMPIAMTTDSADMAWMSYDSPDEQLLKRETRAVLSVSPDGFLSRLFKDPAKISDGAKLLTEMFTIASDMQDVDGLGVSLYPFFTREEMQACYRQSCDKMWQQNGLSPASHGIPAQCAARLWGNIVQEADKALASRQPTVTLRFGHDTALYRLLALLGASPVADGGGANLCDIVPMAANLQTAFFRNGADSVAVGFWLNERPMRLAGADSCRLCVVPQSLPGDTLTLYSWTALKQRFSHYLVTQRWKDRVAAVNTMVGTDYAVTRSVGRYGKGSEEHGQTLPAVLEPHGMNFWTPQTRATERKCVAPYYYPDTLLQGFRASHWIVGGCTQDYGSFTLMPMTGRLRLKTEERATPFSHRGEVSHPHYYAVRLPREHLVAELTATARAALFRFTADSSGLVHVVVNPNSDYREGFVAVDSVHRLVYGYNPVHRIYQGWGESAGFAGWFVVQFPDSVATSSGVVANGRWAASGVVDTVAFVSFAVGAGESVVARAATSFTGLDGALRNLQAELPAADFLAMRLRLDSIWQRQLARIDVDDSSAARVAEFYGALYRASFLPRVMSDVDGLHPKFGSRGKVPFRLATQETHQLPPHLGQGQEVGLPSYYSDYSLWDVYRAELPLLTIIDPARMDDIMQSLVTKYEEGGWMPIFPCWNSYTAAMIGDHAAAAFADAWVKGVRGFDIGKAYAGVRKNAFESPKTEAEYKDGMGRRALKSYLRWGYIPLEDSVMEAFHTHEQVSRTLEYAYDDFCAAQLARAVGCDSDYSELMRRSGNWRNVINPRTGWADGRHAPAGRRSAGRAGRGGAWLGNTDLTHRLPFITEGTVMHYSFYVPHDIDGLVAAMGGRDRFIAKLDTLFGLTYKSPTPSPSPKWGGAENASGDDCVRSNDAAIRPSGSAIRPSDTSSPSPFGGEERGGAGGSEDRPVYYWHGNEPCHHIAYLYALVGQPWKTQWLVREILGSEYMDVPGGLSGNDDAGQMSAWYVFSSLGFYPVCPGRAEYVIGAPQFRRAQIGRLTIEADNAGPDCPFVGAVYWNGQPYHSPVITHDMITRGGTLRFVMARCPVR